MSDEQRQLDVYEVAVVITADSHNPTILHPSFLSSHNIVPPSWKAINDTVICSLPISKVDFDSGISFQAEPHRLQIKHSQLSAAAHDSIVPDIAIKYLQVLPEVRYKSVGLNLSAFWETSDPESYIVNKYVKPGVWNSGDSPLDSIGVQFIYNRVGARVSVRIECGARRQPEPAAKGCVIKINYHYELDEQKKAVTAACDAVSQFGAVVKDATELLNRILVSS